MKDQKKALRRELLELRRAMTASERTSADQKIANLFLSLDEYKNADTLLLYASYGEEIDTFGIARKALADGKSIAYPRCNPDHTMDFCICREGELTAGFKNIPEPPKNAPLFQKGGRAICIVPGLIFDRRGFRIGYGGGFYDRFLADFTGISVGLVRDRFFVDSLPREEFDLPVNIMVTQNEVIYNEN